MIQYFTPPRAMIEKRNPEGVMCVEVQKKNEEKKDDPDMLDELIFRALGRVIITRTPYGYRMAAPREKARKSCSRA